MNTHKVNTIETANPNNNQRNNDSACSGAYLKDTLIAYIGNKRRLMPFIAGEIRNIIENDSGSINTALDLFAGSGSISRLLRTFELKVHSNDIEYYSYILNYAHNAILPNDEKDMFAGFGGVDAMLDMLNNMPTVDSSDRYISEYYAPKDDNDPDIIHERMFYTQENARIIDTVRHVIEDIYKSDSINTKEYYYLLARLIYEATTHSNTSGVFKAFHRGFGGRGADALGRILKPISMSRLPLYGDIAGTASNMEAGEFLRKSKKSFDIVYIDPPYNQHQYGSNYHLLNTIAHWDKPIVNKDIIVDGKKTNKSAIRRDWTNTRSEYCYKNRAEVAFKDMIGNIDAKYMMVSYSTDGIINYDNFIDILTERGDLSIATKEYTKYPGGKRSTVNKTKNIEYLFIVNTTKKHKAKNRSKYQHIEKIKDIDLLLNNSFKSSLDKLVFEYDKEAIELELNHNVHIANKEAVRSKLEYKNIDYINQFTNYLKSHIIDEPYSEMGYFIELLEKAIENAHIGVNTKSINYLLSNINKLYVRFTNRKSAHLLDTINSNLEPILEYLKMNDISTSEMTKLEGKMFSHQL